MIRVLGIDYGEARIGVALSDELGMLAHPYETIAVKEGSVFERIREIAIKEKVTTIVVGLPRNMDGTYGPSAEKAKVFGETLKEKTGLMIKFWDERLTTVAAQRSLHEAGRNTKKSKSVIDQVAAQILLQNYLDSQQMGGL